MNRLLAGLLGVSLGCAVIVGAAPAAAQESGPLSSVVDLSDLNLESGRNRDGRETAQGDDGDTITYTIVENPDTTTDATTNVTPEPPAPPDLSRVPGATEETIDETAEETVAAPLSGEPVSAPVTAPPTESVAGDTTTAEPVAEAAPTVAVCTDFPSWYDAQVFYESMGGTAASAELVGSLDPDVDGFACEEMIEY